MVRVQKKVGERAHLLVSVHEVHDTVVVVVVVHILGCIHWQHQVVGSQPIPLCVSVTEDTSLQHLVITVPDTCSVYTIAQKPDLL